MPLKPFHTRRARADLRQIWRYIAPDNPRAADAVLRQIMKHIALLAEHPGIGPRRNELREGMRSYNSEPYVIFFEAQTEQLRVIRVMHGRRDFKPRMFERDDD